MSTERIPFQTKLRTFLKTSKLEQKVPNLEKPDHTSHRMRFKEKLQAYAASKSQTSPKRNNTFVQKMRAKIQQYKNKK